MSKDGIVARAMGEESVLYFLSRNYVIIDTSRTL